jgi:hypothetical protein
MAEFVRPAKTVGGLALDAVKGLSRWLNPAMTIVRDSAKA